MRGGAFVSFEGIDGSGKSTQARLLSDTLRQRGREVILTREPGGSPGAEAIRSLLVEGATDRWSAETELLLFCAARRDHVEKTIRPALAQGHTVICDRFADSTRVYQGVTRGDLRESVDLLHSQMIGIEPDVTILIDMDPETSYARTAKRGQSETRFEDFGLQMQRDLRAGFLALAGAHPDRIMQVDGTGDYQAVAHRVLSVVAPFLEDR